MNTPTVQNVFRHWRRWRTWAGLLLLAATFFVIESHRQVWPQSNASQSQAFLEWVSSQPTPEQQDVFVDGVIRLQFNRPLDPNLQRLAVQLDPPAAVIFDVQGDELLLKPRDPLRFSTRYTLTLSPQEGLPLEQAIQLSFRTEPQFTYERDVKPLLEASCVGCHQPAGRQRTQLLDSYEATMAYVRPGDPNSELINPRWTRPPRLPSSTPLTPTAPKLAADPLRLPTFKPAGCPCPVWAFGHPRKSRSSAPGLCRMAPLAPAPAYRWATE
jgi:hypothetical protein